MFSFKQISVIEAKSMMESRQATVVDIRDGQSFQQGHIAGAVHLDNTTVQSFLETADLDLPLIVYCYHGHSSMSAAQFLCEKGFDEVYSMDGGYEMWHGQFGN
jgi:thiosulfate sulfurtransferase